MLHVGVGTSTNAQADEAVKQAISSARDMMGENTPVFSMIFASSKYSQQVILETAKTQLGATVPILGGSTAGEIGPSGPSVTSSVVCLLVAGEGIAAQYHAIESANESPEEKARELVASLAAAGTLPDLLCMVADGLAVNPSALLRGIHTSAPALPVVGGSAGDDGQYKETYQYGREGVLSKSATFLALSGKLRYAVGVRHGWNPISGPKKITKASGTVIHEIDGKPAIKLYEEFVGVDEAEALKEKTLATLALSYPLGVQDAESGEMLLRAPFYVDAAGSITCGGEVQEGANVQLMMGSKEAAVEAARESAKKAMSDLGTKPAAAIIFNCHVRDTLFASRDEAKKEIDAIQEVIGRDVPLAGFYTYAEQAPINGINYNMQSCANTNHNETIVILLLAARD